MIALDRSEAITKHLFSRNGKQFVSILKLDSAFLAGLVAFSLALPIPDLERRLLVLAGAALAGRELADMHRARGR
jgi:hypothetical protein